MGGDERQTGEGINKFIHIFIYVWLTHTAYASITPWLRIKTVHARIKKSSPSAPWMTLVSGSVKLSQKFGRGHPEWEHQTRGSTENWRFSTNKLPYLRNGATGPRLLLTVRVPIFDLLLLLSRRICFSHSICPLQAFLQFIAVLYAESVLVVLWTQYQVWPKGQGNHAV